MKNKKKLLIAVAAMGLLAVGTAGAATAAWFSVDNADTDVTPATQSIAVVDNDTSVGGVMFSAVKGSPTLPVGGLELSDDNGATKLQVGGNTPTKPGVTFSNTYATIPVSVTVSNVSGGATFAEKIASLAGDSVVLDVTGAFTTNAGKESCLKYKFSAAPAKSSNGWKDESVTGIKSYTITGSETDGQTIVASFNLYVGIDGEDANATEALAEDTITITITPRYVAA